VVDRSEGHGRVEVEIGAALHEMHELSRLEGAHVGHHHLERPEHVHHTLEAGTAVVLVGPGRGAHVNEEETIEGEEALVEGEHPGIVGKEALHVDVELETGKAVADEPFLRHLHHVRIVGMHRAEGYARGHARPHAVQPRVDIPGHARLVRVGEIDEALHPALGEIGRHLLGHRRMLQLPRRALGEPSPDGAAEPIGMEMGVDVDVAKSRGRLHQALTIQVPGQPVTSTSARTRPALARRATACAVSLVPRPNTRAMRAGVE
jgi:hypothetical protein